MYWEFTHRKQWRWIKVKKDSVFFEKLTPLAFLILANWILLSIKSLEKNWSTHENKCISESMSFFDGLLMRLVRNWCEIDAHNGVEMSVSHKPKIARIGRFFMIAAHEDCHRYILVNIVVDNFLMRFWIVAQHFGSYIFIPKRCVSLRSTTYQKFILDLPEKASENWFTRQKSRISKN